MSDIRLIPVLAAFAPVPRVAASEAERLLRCPLRFVLDKDTTLRRMQPSSAAAIVGTAAHAVLAAMIRAAGSAELSDTGEKTKPVARKVFDEALARECARRDQLIVQRGRLPGDSTEEPAALPFYAMTRARLGRLAVERFGEAWLWRMPLVATRGRPHEHADPDRESMNPVEAELLIRSWDGLVLGVADSVDTRGAKLVIEELKSGDATAERLTSWRHQLLIYAHLYQEQHGRAPDFLRIYSLPGGTHEFPCDPAEAKRAVDGAREALLALNQRLACGTAAGDLARPSEDACPSCPHRPWCQPYWDAGMPGAGGADLEGMVVGTDGWHAELRKAGGDAVRVDFRPASVQPRAGTCLRVCGVWRGGDDLLRTSSTTSVWRVPA